MDEIKKMLVENPNAIENILHKLEFHKIRKYGNEIICGNSENGRGGSIHIKLEESLTSSDFKYGVTGNFISFLMKKRGLEFKEVLSIVRHELGITDFSFTKKEENSIFGGAYKNIKKPNSNRRICEKLDENILIPYKNKFNIRFLRDYISLNTQKKFGIGFDVESQRITVPWYDYEGDLIGIMGRYNGDEEDISRWLPIVSFKKRDYLYGYSQNYKHLVNCDTLYLGESEKFVLQLDSYEVNTSMGIGRGEISSMQIKKAIALNPKRIIFCFDEGYPLEIILKNVKATKRLNRYSNIEVGYIYDENNDIMPKNSKVSPSDQGKVAFEYLVENYVRMVV